MTKPVVTSLTFTPTQPTTGYVRGTVVKVVAEYTDADSKGAATTTAVLTVTDRAGEVGTLNLPVSWAAYLDVATVTLDVPGKTVTTVSVTDTRAEFTFTV